MSSGGNSKRASMREGPLAALFRKTEEEGLHGEGAAQPQQPEARQAESRQPERPLGSDSRRAERDEARAARQVAPASSAGRVPDPDRLDQLRPAPPSARTPQREPEPIPSRVSRRPRSACAASSRRTSRTTSWSPRGSPRSRVTAARSRPWRSFRSPCTSRC